MEILYHCSWLPDSPWVGVRMRVRVRWGLRKRELEAEESSGKWGKNRGGMVN